MVGYMRIFPFTNYRIFQVCLPLTVSTLSSFFIYVNYCNFLSENVSENQQCRETIFAWVCNPANICLGDVRGSGLVLKVVSQGEDHVYICLFGNKLKSLEVRNRKLTPIKETLQSLPTWGDSKENRIKFCFEHRKIFILNWMVLVKRSFPFIILQLEGRMSVNTVYVTLNKRFILWKV